MADGPAEDSAAAAGGGWHRKMLICWLNTQVRHCADLLRGMCSSRLVGPRRRALCACARLYDTSRCAGGSRQRHSR
jgi:hypothetical protein